jgi:hypothetical protein
VSSGGIKQARQGEVRISVCSSIVGLLPDWSRIALRSTLVFEVWSRRNAL